jgi:XTP/dITP diphosphohydrolase
VTPGRIVLLVTSPRLPVGLLTAAAWDLLRAHPVYALAETAQVAAVRSVGVPVRVGPLGATELIAAAADAGSVVLLAGPGGDADFARDLGLRLAREPGGAELELAYGSWDPPGARLLDAVTVMDRLRTGDAWKRAQTHRSLAPYLLEEAYEAYDALLTDDYQALREELGDVLLQVVLHARLAEELPDGQAYTIDDVAGDLVDKMIRRNPHVFGGEPTDDIEEIVRRWEAAKRAEKPRNSALDGIAWSQSALSLAEKVLSRAANRGIEVATSDDLGGRLLALVAQADRDGLDAEAALREAVLALAERVRAGETA